LLTEPTGQTPGSLLLGARNSDRWGNYFTLDLRGAWTWRFARADLVATLELTNATDRENPCCTELESAAPGQLLTVETEHWLPTIVNLGVVYRWRRK
jgi:hypothetical protein